MGEAKRRREKAKMMVYHHTSTLRTNLLWMSGEIKPEGQMPPVLHPQLGIVETDARFRRPMKDFPPVAWFTTRLEIPHCLIQMDLIFRKDNGQKHTVNVATDVSNAIALNRVALGFMISNIPVVPWPAHPGFDTAEGKDLNDTARECGDNPLDWYVSEQPVDLMKMNETWVSRSVLKPKLERMDWYLADVKKMVAKCRETPGVYIPPSWMKQEHAEEMSRRAGIPIGNL